MNVLVAYYSETGNTRKVAEAVFAALQHNRKQLLAIDQVGDLDPFNLLFCGFPVQHHSVPAKTVHFLRRIPEKKNIALIATHGSLRGGEKALAAFFAAISLLQGRTVVGTFGCRGQVRPQLLDQWTEEPQHQAWAREALSANGHPDAADLEDARAFAQSMLYASEHIHRIGKRS